MQAPSFTISRVEARAYRFKSPNPVRSSYVSMQARSATYVQIEDDEGAIGWGEIWCNFPECGSLHRVRLVETLAADLLVGKAFQDPQHLYQHLTDALTPFMIQSGEFGPLAQVISGLDTAGWDLSARKAGISISKLITDTPATSVNTYASALDVDDAGAAATPLVNDGFKAFKLKVGFPGTRDEDNLRGIRSAAGDDALIIVDGNQRWDVEQAIDAISKMTDFGVSLVEEPLSVHAPDVDWLELARRGGIDLATGENIMSDAEFRRYIDAGAINHLQPDIAKWGGISGTLVHARHAVESGTKVTPHMLSGGIGLLASAQLLAGVGGGGYQEWDANENPLRQLIVQMPDLEDGKLVVPTGPGIGAEPNWSALDEYRIDND